MQNTTDIALSRLMAETRRIDVLANNIANVNTPGFKASRMLFSAWLDPQRLGALPPGERALAYANDRATYRDVRAGSIRKTGNPLDLAIPGSGYFTVSTTRGVRLTRAGRFSLSSDGTVSDFEGNKLLDANSRPITIPAGDTNITIAGDGTISSSSGTIGQIGIVTANDEYRLKSEGGRLLDPGSSGFTALSDPKVIQGAVEDSNVEPVHELTRMMTAMREFQYIANFVQAESDRMQSAITKITTKA